MPEVLVVERVVRVTFKKTVSDGSYGVESAEISLEQAVVPEVDDDDVIGQALLMEARRLVHAELLRSPSARVRGAVEPPSPRRTIPVGPPPEPDDEDPVFEAQPWR